MWSPFQQSLRPRDLRSIWQWGSRWPVTPGCFQLTSACVLVGLRGKQRAHSVHAERVGERGRQRLKSEKSLASNHTGGTRDPKS